MNKLAFCAAALLMASTATSASAARGFATDDYGYPVTSSRGAYGAQDIQSRIASGQRSVRYVRSTPTTVRSTPATVRSTPVTVSSTPVRTVTATSRVATPRTTTRRPAAVSFSALRFFR